MIEQPLLLGFDASTPRSVIALGRLTQDGDRPHILASDIEENGANQASAALVDRIQQVLETAGVRREDVDLVGCGHGPGTFTGVRVALASAQGIALGLGVPVVSSSSLEILAWGAQRTASPSAAPMRHVLSLLDARRGEVYASLSSTEVQAGPVVHIEPHLARIDRVLERVRGVVETHHVTAIGSGALVYRTEVERAGLDVAPESSSHPSPAGLIAALFATYRTIGAVDCAELQALYLRKSYAELGIHQPKRKFVPSPFAPSRESS